jgi:hypothetical protein
MVLLALSVAKSGFIRLGLDEIERLSVFDFKSCKKTMGKNKIKKKWQEDKKLLAI